MYFMCSVSLHERMFHTSMINQQIHVTIRKATGSQMQPQVISSYISYNYFILILFLLYEPLMMIRSVTKTCWWRIIMSLKIFINVYLLICGNKMPTRCNRFLLQILLLAQHVSGITMPIIRSSRVLYSGCCLWYIVLWFFK